MSQNKERSGSHKNHGYGRKRQHHPKNNRQRQPRPAPHLNYESLLLRFTACIDCGYFFTSYRAHHGDEVVRQALKASNQSRDGWIELPWDLRTSELIHRFYAIRSDTHIDHLEFLCSGCQRKFICAEIENEEADAQIDVADDDDMPNEPLSNETENETENEIADVEDMDLEEETAVEETESSETEIRFPKQSPRVFRVELKTR